MFSHLRRILVLLSCSWEPCCILMDLWKPLYQSNRRIYICSVSLHLRLSEWDEEKSVSRLISLVRFIGFLYMPQLIVILFTIFPFLIRKYSCWNIYEKILSIHCESQLGIAKKSVYKLPTFNYRNKVNVTEWSMTVWSVWKIPWRHLGTLI